MIRTKEEAQVLITAYEKENPRVFCMEVDSNGSIFITRYFETSTRTNIKIPDFVTGFKSKEIPIEDYYNKPTEELFEHSRYVDCVFYRTNLTSIELGKSLSNLNDMFQDCDIEKLNLSDWDVSKITEMENTFLNCKLGSNDLSNWDVSSVTSMEAMFYESTVSECLDIANWNVSNVVEMTDMFRNFSGDINVTAWNVNSVDSMWGMFWNYDGNLNVSKWNVSNVQDMRCMFCNYTGVPDISNWNTHPDVDTKDMFRR